MKTRHNVYLSAQTWAYLNQAGEPSRMIEKLVEEKMDEIIDGAKLLKDFAETVADAYVSQYVDQQGRRVMGQPVVYYNRTENRFGWTSSMTPLNDDEVLVETLERGIYGDEAETATEERAAIVEFITSQTDPRDLLEKILGM